MQLALAPRSIHPRRNVRPARRAQTRPVRFVMLGPLVSIGWRPERPRTERIPAAIIATLHLAAVLTLRLAVPSGDVSDTKAMAVTYLDVPPPAEPESPRAAMTRARPLIVAQSVIIPAAEAAVAHPDQAAGFQELLAPQDVPRLPPMGQVGGVAVSEADFSGRGIAGGVAGGKPPVALPDSIAARLMQQGEAADAVTPVQRQQRARGWVDESDVLVRPELRNIAVMRQMLLEVYPPVMRQAGIEGHAVIEFIIDTTGRIRPGSGRVLEASQPLFGDAALSLLRFAEFTPGRAEYGTRSVAVAVKVRLPLTWTMRKIDPPED